MVALRSFPLAAWSERLRGERQVEEESVANLL
jgi:hypothetical protein